jgi:hypothetical protein
VLRLGEFLIMRGRVSKTDVDMACQMQLVNNHMIGVIAVDHGLLTPGELEKVLRHQTEATHHLPFGEIAVGLGLLSHTELEELLRIQSEDRLRIGEVLVLQSCLTEQELIGELTAYRKFVAAENGRRSA